MPKAEPTEQSDFSLSATCGLVALLVIGFVASLRLEGREFLSDAGVGIWTGAETHRTSQWLFDPYTFTHVEHGIFFYWLLFPLRRRWGVRTRFLAAGLAEGAWEILENSPFVIDRYRMTTAALDYYGDSILNSTFDLAASMAGFWIAAKWGWKWSLLLVVVTELLLAFVVRDNLALNVLMLLYPFPSIKAWQLGN